MAIAEFASCGGFCGGWRRLLHVMRRESGLRRAAAASVTQCATPIDPVALTVMAVERLGPAAWRAILSGTPVTVTAPDAETVEIFRAALRRMAEDRPTHRLISVELPAARRAAT